MILTGGWIWSGDYSDWVMILRFSRGDECHLVTHDDWAMILTGRSSLCSLLLSLREARRSSIWVTVSTDTLLLHCTLLLTVHTNRPQPFLLLTSTAAVEAWFAGGPFVSHTYSPTREPQTGKYCAAESSVWVIDRTLRVTLVGRTMLHLGSNQPGEWRYGAPWCYTSAGTSAGRVTLHLVWHQLNEWRYISCDVSWGEWRYTSCDVSGESDAAPRVTSAGWVTLHIVWRQLGERRYTSCDVSWESDATSRVTSAGRVTLHLAWGHNVSLSFKTSTMAESSSTHVVSLRADNETVFTALFADL